MADSNAQDAVNLESADAEAIMLDAAAGLVPNTSTVPTTPLGFGKPLSIRILSPPVLALSAPRAVCGAAVGRAT